MPSLLPFRLCIFNPFSLEQTPAKRTPESESAVDLVIGETPCDPSRDIPTPEMARVHLRGGYQRTFVLWFPPGECYIAPERGTIEAQIDRLHCDRLAAPEGCSDYKRLFSFTFPWEGLSYSILAYGCSVQGIRYSPYGNRYTIHSDQIL